MLLGTHTPKLDEKGRVILPAKFRDELLSDTKAENAQKPLNPEAEAQRKFLQEV